MRYVRRRVPRMGDPLLDVTLPKKLAARATFYEYPKVRAVLDQVDDLQMRAALALMFGSGIEMGALMVMRGEHVGSPVERTILGLTSSCN